MIPIMLIAGLIMVFAASPVFSILDVLFTALDPNPDSVFYNAAAISSIDIAISGWYLFALLVSILPIIFVGLKIYQKNRYHHQEVIYDEFYQ